MNIRVVLLFLLFLPSHFSDAGKVFLNNGDVISGTVQTLDDGVLLLHSTLMGEIFIPWNNVDNIQSDQPLSLILRNGDRITGRLVPDENSPFVIQSQLFDRVPLPKQRIYAIGVESNIRLQNKLETANAKIEDLSSTLSESNITIDDLNTKLAAATEIPQLWSGSVSLLGGLKSGNRQSYDLYLKSVAIRETEDEKLTLRGDFGYGDSQGIVDTTEGRVQSNLRVYFRKNQYVFGDLQLEHDRFEDLELRVDGTVGYGYRFWKTKESEFSLDAGAGATHENFRSNGSDTEPVLRFGAEFSQIIFDETRLSQELTVYPSVGTVGEMRLISRTSFITPILDSLSWDLTITDEYDTDPRAGIKNNDVSVRTGLSYTF